MDQPTKKLGLKIRNMHCASCEILIEQKFKKIKGVTKARVNHARGRAEVYCSEAPALSQFQEAVAEHGYEVSLEDDDDEPADSSGGGSPQATGHSNTEKDYFQIGAIFLILVAAWLILRQFDFLPSFGISENMSYGFVFLIGLVAAMSTCLAVTGGLLLAVAAKHNERFPNLTGLEKIKPHIYFNAGRIVSYTVLGAAVGALGSILTFSPRATGFMTIIASAVMIILGFQLLKLFPWMKRFQPKMPKFLAHKIHEATGKDSKFAPFLLGASTFFLPCGFTQALQLYVLAKGDALTGGLTMLAFSLGTLPALMSLSAISSFAKGSFQRHFLKVAGVIVVMLGFFNINNGLTLAGASFNLSTVLGAGPAQENTKAAKNAVPIVNGKQVVEMKVVGLSYIPSRFTITAGIPVEWRIDGTDTQGCAQVINVPKLGIAKYLSSSKTTVINFTPEETGTISFSCPMGMTTPGAAFKVVANPDGAAISTKGSSSRRLEEEPATSSGTTCDPATADCVEPRKLSMNITYDIGPDPSSFTIKKGVPVELTMNNTVPLGGCMSIWVIPEFDVTIPMKVGINKVSFTPTETGTIFMTCSMGSPLVQFDIID